MCFSSSFRLHGYPISTSSPVALVSRLLVRRTFYLLSLLLIYGYYCLVCFFAIIPLSRLFEYGGEQMTYYVGKDLGDLILVTLNKSVPCLVP